MAQVAEKLSILKMTQEERANYSYYQKKVYNDRDELQAAEARGKAEGMAERDYQIVKRLLLKKVPIEEIADITDLSLEQIQDIAKKP
jgi:predicted transposase/invertase (TIGR01784 family)